MQTFVYAVLPQVRVAWAGIAIYTWDVVFRASTVVVRALAAHDRARWTPLWDAYNAFYGRHGDTALPGAITQATWQRFFDDAEPVFALVLAWAVLGQTIAPMQVVGGLVVWTLAQNAKG